MGKLSSYIILGFNLVRYDTRFQIGTILLIIAFYTVLIGNFWSEVDNLAAALITALILDGLVLRIKLKKWARPSSAVVTGLLVGLILNPNFALWQFVLVAAGAVFSKYLILPGKKHIFNPAAFGLVVSSLAFRDATTWWGVSWNQDIWIFIFATVSIVLWRLRRIWLPVGFLLVYWLYLTTQGSFSNSVITDPTIALFAFIMLPEPQTSPIKGSFRYTFGILVGVLLVIYSVFLPRLPTDSLLISLITANVVGFSLTKPAR